MGLKKATQLVRVLDFLGIFGLGQSSKAQINLLFLTTPFFLGLDLVSLICSFLFYKALRARPNHSGTTEWQMANCDSVSHFAPILLAYPVFQSEQQRHSLATF